MLSGAWSDEDSEHSGDEEEGEEEEDREEDPEEGEDDEDDAEERGWPYHFKPNLVTQ